MAGWCGGFLTSKVRPLVECRAESGWCEESEQEEEGGGRALTGNRKETRDKRRSVIGEGHWHGRRVAGMRLPLTPRPISFRYAGHPQCIIKARLRWSFAAR